MALPHFEIAIALIWHDGKVLVARRRDDAEHLPNVWEFPGGKCDAGESPRECAIREASEELGVEIEITGERASIDHEYSARRVTLHPFDCRIVAGEPHANMHQKIAWRAPDELRPELFPAANAGLIVTLQNQAR